MNKSIIKKGIAGVGTMILTILIAACQTVSTTAVSTSEPTTTFLTTGTSTSDTDVSSTSVVTTTRTSQFQIIDNPYYLGVKTEKMSLILQKTDGSITSLKNEVTKVDYLLDSDGHNWFMVVDHQTSDPYLTQPESSENLYLSSRMYRPTIRVQQDDDVLRIILRYDLDFFGDIDMSGLSVVQTIRWDAQDTMLDVSYHLENYTQFASVIMKFSGMILSGLSESNQNLDLFWSDKEGRIVEDILPYAKANHLSYKMAYPSPYSTQLMQLYNAQGSLFYFIEDPTREFKQFFFGVFDSPYNHNEQVLSNPVSMGVEQYPFLSFGHEIDLWTIKVGVSSNPEWYDGADLYRDYLIGMGMNRDYNDYVETFTGFANTVIAWAYDDFVQTYNGEFNPAITISSLDHVGIDAVLLLGWHQGGFDSKYPDYEYYEGEYYGEANFIDMVETIHENDDVVFAYLNGHIAAANSKWSVKLTENDVPNMFASAIKKPGFQSSLYPHQYGPYLYLERYGTGLDYYAMCRKDLAFQDILLEAVERLVYAGIDGLWFDQMMEMPAYLCFDKNHGHHTPATAYAEGYQEIFEKIEAIFAKYNKTDYLLFAEGTTDAWIEYLDICGLMWGRLLYAGNMSPNLTKYTIPAKFLGLSGYNIDLPHAYAFLFGSPIVDAASMTDQKIIEVYNNNPQIYFRGRYLDQRGLDISDAAIKGSLIVSDSLQEIGVQLYNPTKQSITFTISLSLDELGVTGFEQVGWQNLFTNTSVSTQETTITITMEPNSILAYKAILE